MKRFKLVVAYDGTAYCGYQYQPELPTVEGFVNDALSELLGENIVIIGASRTDAGVHAYGNVAVFDSDTRIPAEKLALALNTKLADDIRIMESLEVAADFHPRKNVIDKTYEYRINTAKISFPTDRLYSYNVKHNLDIEAMREAAKYIEGRHDFTSFCSAKTDKEDKVRTVFQIDVEETLRSELIIRVRGDGFLYNMVRIIAGTLVKVGEGKISPNEIPSIIERKDRGHLGTTLPAKGLFLMGIRYKEEG
ncbi:tRNA pseudouridine synthase A [Catonella morbi ATCC 51271]|uniref:tRNA pseudouridine synthase A n=1 Tax=Catonella morbi ATCC 51271 TaxID=592026 RepID=V2Y855_9FIRM|nr:tRNA pseudouridine(38-40) synthase TruA [Catonella morbi]ESL04287.1 tRNA pseudouridine synthase A [Catonella morbi ATCC 51271]